MSALSPNATATYQLAYSAMMGISSRLRRQAPGMEHCHSCSKQWCSSQRGGIPAMPPHIERRPWPRLAALQHACMHCCTESASLGCK